MIVEPKVRGFICTTAHPEGCSKEVQRWIDYVKSKSPIHDGPKNVLVIGASTGFGLASRISLAFGAKAKTIGVFFEAPASDKRTASPGWYNTGAFTQAAHAEGLYAKNINGDAFSDEIKQRTIDLIKKDWPEGVDLIIYSIASPRRTHPKTGEKFSSVLKPIGKPFKNKTVDINNGIITEIALEPATQAEIDATVQVMGGEDWEMWIEALNKEKLLARHAKTVAYTYVGPQVTQAIYRQGTIGQAKEHLEKTAHQLDALLQKSVDGQALIAVNKALVTQASAAIPVVPLYISLLYRVMKARNLHEGCIEQMWRLFGERLYGHEGWALDDAGRVRMDDWEMRPDVQQEVAQQWENVTTENLNQVGDIVGYREEFYRLFGFGISNVNYKQDIAVDRPIKDLVE